MTLRKSGHASLAGGPIMLRRGWPHDPAKLPARWPHDPANRQVGGRPASAQPRSTRARIPPSGGDDCLGSLAPPRPGSNGHAGPVPNWPAFQCDWTVDPVGTAPSGRPPDRARRADFPHRAPTFGLRASEAHARPRVHDAWDGKRISGFEASGFVGRPASALASPLKLAMPFAFDVPAKRPQRP